MTRIENLMHMARRHLETVRYCRDCKKFRKNECRYMFKGKPYDILPTDQACLDFKGRSRQRGEKGAKEWELALCEKIPETLKPCGFYEDVLTESVWLPYRKGNEVKLRPSLILARKGQQVEILDFHKQKQIRGTFPSQEMHSLMSVSGVQKLISGEPVDPHETDMKIDEALQKHLAMPTAEKILAKRWIESTYFYDCFDALPIESILGISESGKSRLVLLNLALCYHAESMIDPTEASIFRTKEEDRVSLIIDEGEYLNNPKLYQTLRILINSSYSRFAGYVTRYDEEDGKRVKRRFDLYSPMCIAGIAGLEGVTLSRAFQIVMRKVDKDYPKANPNDYRDLRDALYVLRVRHAFDVHDLYKGLDISDFVSARFEELFKPIFAITKFMGTQEEWSILKDWCADYQENFRVECLNVFEEEMVLLSLAKQKEVMPDWIKISDVAETVNAEYNRKVSSRHVSSVLRRLGLVRRKKYQGLTLVYAPKELIEESSKRIGVHVSDLQSPQSLQTPQPSQKPEEWREVFKKADSTD